MKSTILTCLAALAFGVCLHPAQAQTLTVLQSELRTTFGDLDSAQVLSAYAYDNQGNRVTRAVYDGPDSTAPRMSASTFRYTASSKLAEELIETGADTLTLTRHSYNADGDLSASRTYGPGLALRFRDSCVYDAGRLIETIRFTGIDVTPLFYHIYSYDLTSNLKTSDTLFEASSGVFAATQVVAFAYTPEGRVSSESSWRRSGSAWFQITTTSMTYAAGKLTAVTTRNGSAVSGACTDSIAYAYDADGNRVTEATFNDEAVLSQRVAFTWMQIPVVRAIIPLADRSAPRRVASEANLFFNVAGRSVGSVPTAHLILIGVRDGSTRLTSPRNSSLHRTYN
jgi:hypothetical protein